ncbi:MAG: TonB-dependent receptor [Acidobacteriota bacterium]
MLKWFNHASVRLVAALILSLVVMGLRPAVSSYAQSTSGTLEGQVFDPSGKPIGGAKVTIISEVNGSKRATLTDSGGSYRVAFLPPGLYTITASLAGFADAGVHGFRLQLNATNPVKPPDITLGAAAQTQPTQPTQPTTTPVAQTAASGEALLNLTDASRGGNFSERQVETLPLGATGDQRTFDDLALLVAGVAPPPFTPGVRGPGLGFGIGTSGQFSVNGSRARSNNFTVDGSDFNDPDVGVRRQGFLALIPQPIESIREFQISTLLWSPELGRNVGSQVNAVSKEGGNDFHGQAYGFVTDSALNAKNFFDYTGRASGGEDDFTRTQFGLVVGGPIKQERTQFFGSFERLDVRLLTEQHFAVPTPGERRFLGLGAFSVLGPNPFNPGNLLLFGTTLGATPLGRNVLSFYPLPNNPGGPYGRNTRTELLPADGEGSIVSFKITHQVNEKNSLNARYNFTDDTRTLPSVNRALRSSIDADTRTQNFSLIFDTQLTLSLYNQARFSYGRTRLDFIELDSGPFNLIADTPTIVSVDGAPFEIPSSTGTIGEIIIEPFSPVGVNSYTFPQDRTSNTFQYADTLSWNYLQHTFKFGADIRRIQFNNRQDRNFRPQVVFGNAILTTGALNLNQQTLSFAADPQRFLLEGINLAALGLPSSVFQTLSFGPPDSTIGLRVTEYNFFVKDTWKARPNLSFDFGVRYEYNTVPREVNRRIENALSLTGIPAENSTVSNPLFTQAFNQSVAAYRRVLGDRTGIYEPDRNNFGPYFGFAWDPWRDGKTVVRGGAGVYYDAVLGAVVSQSRNVFPTQIPINIEPSFTGDFDVFFLNNPAFFGLGPIPLIQPGTGNQLGGGPGDFIPLAGALFRQNRGGGGLSFTLPERELRTPYTQRWHLTLERQLFNDYAISAAYVGTKGTKLTRLTTPNLGPNVTPSVNLATRSNAFPTPLVLGICQFLGCSLRPPRPVPELGAFQIYENSASSTYHSMQVEMRKRYSRGYQYTIAYTWSHAIDDVSDIFPIAGAPVIAQNSLNLSQERGDANFDTRQRLSASVVWDLPIYRNETTTAAKILGGWQMATIFQTQTGQPFTLNVPFDVNLDGNLTDRPRTTNGLLFFDGHRREKVAIADGKTVTDFFARLGQDGAVGRNTLRADNFIAWDVAVVKTFRFTEFQNLIFRTDVFNVLNRANFGTPIRILGSPGFGAAVDTATPARQIQFALKYSF